MQAIVAADLNFAIGCGGQMIYHLPEDLKFFARMTRGKVLVMGRGTLESLPGGKPLKDRVNIVLSRDARCAPPGVVMARSLSQLEAIIAPYPADEVMVIGGQQIYALLIDCCSQAHVTRVRATAPADRFFPNLDQRPGWELAEESPVYESGGIPYTHCLYVNRQSKPLSAITQPR
jgi:dihydrofolate reductase